MKAFCRSPARNTQRSCTLRVSQTKSTLPCSFSLSTCQSTLATCAYVSCLSLTSLSIDSWSFFLCPSLWKRCWTIWEGCISSTVSQGYYKELMRWWNITVSWKSKMNMATCWNVSPFRPTSHIFVQHTALLWTTPERQNQPEEKTSSCHHVFFKGLEMIL